MEGSAAPEQPDHRADARTPASNAQGHDAGHTGVAIEEQAEQQARPSTEEVMAPSPPRTTPAPETAAPARPTPASPAQAPARPTPASPAQPTPVASVQAAPVPPTLPTPAAPTTSAGAPAAPTPTSFPLASAAAGPLPRAPSAGAAASAQGTLTTQRPSAAAQTQKRPATSSPTRQPPKKTRTDTAAPGASASPGTDVGGDRAVVVHAAQAALSAASALRLGTVRARTSSGTILGPFEATWAKPWNEADVDMDVAHADALGGVHLGQKQTRTQNALNELFTSWNEQMKTTKVLFYRHHV